MEQSFLDERWLPKSIFCLRGYNRLGQRPMASPGKGPGAGFSKLHY
jgi:hypothetical protein